MANGETERVRALRVDVHGDGIAILVGKNGVTTGELLLSADETIALHQLLHPHLPRILSSQTRGGTGSATPRYALPATGFVLNQDQMQGLVLLTVEDQLGANLTYGVQPGQARALADSLVRWADKVEKTSKPPEIH